MASGGLPALAKLSVRLGGRLGAVDEVRSCVAPALEAVAGTLTHLHLGEVPDCGEWLSHEVDVAYELGVAVGKLRGLRDLAYEFSRSGRFYSALARGLAATGGDCPLPQLWRLRWSVWLTADAYRSASLLLPSVRVLRLDLHSKSTRRQVDTFDPFHPHIRQSEDRRAALLMACALRQAGYKHALTVFGDVEGVWVTTCAITPCIRGAYNYNHHFGLLGASSINF
jgi:hypothetical protein